MITDFRKLFFIVALFVFFQLKADKIPFDEIVSGINIEHYLEVYKGNNNTPLQLETANTKDFVSFHWDSIPDGKSLTWIRLQIDNTSKYDQELVIGNNQFDYIEFYEKSDEQVEYTVKLSGMLCDHNLMEIVLGANSWISFKLPSNKISTYYMRVSNLKKVNYQYSKLPFSLYEKIDFESYQKKQTIFNYFFWGAMFIITFYNLILFFQLRNRIYLYYVFNNFIILLFVLSQSGLISSLFFENSCYHEQILLVVGNIAFIFYMLFCKEFLDLKTVNPKLNSIISKLLLAWPTPLILILFNQSEIAVSIGGIVAIWAYTMIMVVSYRLIKKGDVGAKFFFTANIFYYVGIIISILQIAKVLPYQFLGLAAVNYVQLGTLLQVSLFSLTVGFRIIKMQKEIVEKHLEQERIKTEEEQKRRILIEEQNAQLEQKVSIRTLELAERNEELKLQSEILVRQKSLLEEKQKEIIDSITYAKRIQYTLLAHTSLLEKHLPEFFILFKPKDIVSGDFYWATKVGNKFYLAVFDCTGHGVPGAFMSLLSIGFLSEAINEKDILDPNKVLDYVRTRIESSVSQDGGKDGMDGTLICITENSNLITYASAYNKPILVSHSNYKDLPADKMPIGKGERAQSFTPFSIEVQKGDRLYLYTDGYADQFGGPKGKKFKYRQLNQLLLSTYTKSFTEQKQELYHTFNNWKNNEEQVDDICLIGLKF